jgi:hypothetical protein
LFLSDLSGSAFALIITHLPTYPINQSRNFILRANCQLLIANGPSGELMPRTSLYNINNNAGAFTSIPSTIPARRVEIREDESVTPQGLQYQKPDDNFTNTYQCGVPAGPDQPQIVLGNVIAHQGRYGALLGLPAQSTGGASIPATVYAKVRAAGVSTSRIRVVEFE